MLSQAAQLTSTFQSGSTTIHHAHTHQGHHRDLRNIFCSTECLRPIMLVPDWADSMGVG